jgi:hypothetical protein
MGYGLIPYGLGEYGEGAAAEAFKLAGVVAISKRQVQVSFNVAPLAASGFGLVDSLNPTKWTVQRLDTLAELPVGAVRLIDAVTVELYLLDPLGDFRIRHGVAVRDIVSFDHAPIVSPLSLEFAGVTDTQVAPGPRPLRPRAVDLDAQPVGDDTFGTALVIRGGDYTTEQGNPLLKKLIVRRLTTKKGAFFHLPDYGIGIASPKSLFSPSDLRALKADIESQVNLEPEVVKTNAALTLDANNSILSILVQARTQTGDDVSVRLPIPTANVVL